MIPHGILKRIVQFSSMLKRIFRKLPANGYITIITDKANAEMIEEK
jgi:hypothetical protein